MPVDLIESFKRWDKKQRLKMRSNNKIKILFDLPNAFSAKAAAPVALELIGRGHFVRFTGRNQNPDSEWNYLSVYPELRKYFRHRYLARWCPWDIIVFTDGPSAAYLRWALKVRFPHGPGEGLYGAPHSLALAKSRGYEILLCTSEFNVRHIESLNPLFVGGQNLFAIGWPCLDVLFQEKAYDRLDILQKMGLSANQKTILITSHWTPASILRVFGGAQILEQLASFRDTNIIVTAHNHLWYRRSVRRELGAAWYENLEAVVEQNPNMRLVRTGDVRPLLSVADLMIGDRSSVTQEYGVLNRPILQFIQRDHMPSNHELDRLYAQTTQRFSTLGELASIVQSQLDDPSIGEKEIRVSFVDRSFSYLGVATKRAADVIEQLQTKS